MSLLQFSNTTTKAGIVETIARRTGTTNTSTSSYPLLDKTVDVNLALMNFKLLANDKSGYRQFDDVNHQNYPILYADIVSGTQDVTFTQDQFGNTISDVYMVRIKTTANGQYIKLTQRDPSDDSFNPDYISTGIPTQFDILENGIIFDVIPNFSLVGAVELTVSRAPSYFVSTDTTKSAGIPEEFQEYLTIRPSYFYCLDKQLPQKQDLYILLYGANGRGGMEAAIKAYFANRNRSVKRRITTTNQRDSNR